MIEKVVTKGGKPFQSKLAPYEAEVKELKANGASVRAIAAEMLARHNLAISHNAVASFLRTCSGHESRSDHGQDVPNIAWRC